MKALSAMVATILLIAFTVAVGGLISVWVTQYSRTTTSAVDTVTANQTKCYGSYIEVDSVTPTLITFSNPSTQIITNINITTTDGKFPTPSSTILSPGGIAVANWTKGTNTSVLIKGLCLSSMMVEGKCDNSQTCWTS